MATYSFWSKILELYGLAWWKVRPVSSKSKRRKRGSQLESLSRRLERGRQRFLAALPEDQLKELQKFEQTEVAAFMRDREERILKAYKGRRGQS